MITLDGSYGEGGGQIVRTALALSTITGKPFTVSGIRNGRSKPGLKAQHVYCVKALQDLCSAEAEGAEVGSFSLTYTPGSITARELSIDIGTAGSITLLLQSVLLPCFFAPGKLALNIIGGTDTRWSMPIDYFKEVFITQVRQYCNEINVELVKRGYYPKGGGKVRITLKPRDLFHAPPLDILQSGKLTEIKGISNASSSLQKGRVAERQQEVARTRLSRLDCQVNIDHHYYDTLSPGSGITVCAEFEKSVVGADALGERGKKAEVVGKEAAERLLQEMKAPVDSHLADNLIPWLALFGGRIRTSRITGHTKTNIYVCEKFFGDTFKIDDTTIESKRRLE